MDTRISRRCAVALLSGMIAAGAASAAPMAGLLDDNAMVLFDSDTPGLTSASHPITGTLVFHTMAAIALRPADGKLYGLSSNVSTAQLYRIDLGTFVATPIGATFEISGSGSLYSMDVSPVADRVRMVSDSGRNLRLNPDTGAVLNTDTGLSYGSGGSGLTAVTGLAYNHSTAGATTTTLYAIDYNQDKLFTIGGVDGVPSPNTGVMSEVGLLGVGNDTRLMGLDISANGDAFALLTPGSIPTLYRVNLGTGAATIQGVFPAAAPVIDVAFLAADPDVIFANGFDIP